MARTAMRISSLTQYPIKSCGGMKLEQAEIDESGLVGDRPLFVIDENGKGLGQTALPRMALIQASLVGAQLSVFAPGQGSLEVRVGRLRVGDEVTALEAQERFVPNDRTAVIAEADLPVPPSDL